MRPERTDARLASGPTRADARGAHTPGAGRVRRRRRTQRTALRTLRTLRDAETRTVGGNAASGQVKGHELELAAPSTWQLPTCERTYTREQTCNVITKTLHRTKLYESARTAGYYGERGGGTRPPAMPKTSATSAASSTSARPLGGNALGTDEH